MGAILLLAAVLRLSFVASFISESVLVGFKSGIGLVIGLISCRSCLASTRTPPSVPAAQRPAPE